MLIIKKLMSRVLVLPLFLFIAPLGVQAESGPWCTHWQVLSGVSSNYGIFHELNAQFSRALKDRSGGCAQASYQIESDQAALEQVLTNSNDSGGGGLFGAVSGPANLIGLFRASAMREYFPEMNTYFALLHGPEPSLLSQQRNLDMLAATYNEFPKYSGEVSVLGLGLYASQVLASNKAISSPQDLRGLRIATSGGGMMMDYYRSLGAKPEPINYRSLLNDLKNGKYDAVTLSWKSLKKEDRYQQFSHITVLNIYPEYYAAVASADLVNSLGEQGRSIVVDTLRDAMDDASRKALVEERDIRREIERDRKTRVIDLTASQLSAWKQSAQAVWNKYNKKSATAGNKPSKTFEDGETARNRGNYKQAQKIFNDLIQHKQTIGHRGLGMMYAQGQYFEADFAKALGHFRKAYEGGDTESARIVGEMYQLGSYVDANPGEALKWLRKAAEGGIESAQRQVALTQSTADDASLRNGREALKWASKICPQPKLAKESSKSKRERADCHRLLGYAHAEAGNFKEAISHEEKYSEIQRAKPLSMMQIMRRNAMKEQGVNITYQYQNGVLAAYQSGKAWRESMDPGGMLEVVVR